MNKRLAPAAVFGLALAVLGALPAAAWAQAAPPPSVRSADFIVAMVNSEPITNAQVQATRARLLREAQARNTPLPSASALTEQALQLLIEETFQLQQAKDLGIKISDEEVQQAEANMAAGNQVSVQEFRARLAREGVSPSALREQLTQQMTLMRLREREVEARLRISDTDIQQYLREQRTQDSPPEINLAMILIAVPENADAASVERLQKQAQDLAARARRGENFAALAQAHSQAMDRGARGGEMGLRPVDRYPELFVQAVGNLPTGGIANPVRSGAGFHILKVLERRASSSTASLTQTRTRHILLRTGPQLSTPQAQAQLQQLREQIQSGRLDFAQAARQYSQDGSASEGGELGWARPGQFVPEFEQVMNRLEPGQLSAPLVSRFGVHLLEVLERRQVPVSERELREMARAALREQRLEETYERWLADLRANTYIEMREPPQVRPLPSR